MSAAISILRPLPGTLRITPFSDPPSGYYSQPRWTTCLRGLSPPVRPESFSVLTTDFANSATLVVVNKGESMETDLHVLLRSHVVAWCQHVVLEFMEQSPLTIARHDRPMLFKFFCAQNNMRSQPLQIIGYCPFHCCSSG